MRRDAIPVLKEYIAPADQLEVACEMKKSAGRCPGNCDECDLKQKLAEDRSS